MKKIFLILVISTYLKSILAHDDIGDWFSESITQDGFSPIIEMQIRESIRESIIGYQCFSHKYAITWVMVGFSAKQWTIWRKVELHWRKLQNLDFFLFIGKNLQLLLLHFQQHYVKIIFANAASNLRYKSFNSFICQLIHKKKIELYILCVFTICIVYILSNPSFR